MSKDGNIDYSDYSYRELLEALNNIDSRNYPKNYDNLIAALEAVGPVQRAALEQPVAEAPAPLPTPTPSGYDVSGFDNPNSDTASSPRSVGHLMTSLIILSVSGYLLWIDNITVPFQQAMTIALTERGAQLALGAFVFAAAVPVSYFLNWADHKENDRRYLMVAHIADGIATMLIAFAIMISTTSVQA